MPVRVLIVDDSALVRRALTDGLSADPDIEVVGSAIDPYVARDKILQLQPDVLTLDIEMPRMDGLTFLKVLMKHHPMPIIVMSSLTTKGSAIALEALQAGAVDVVAKPGSAYCAAVEIGKLADKIKAVARARVRAVPAPAPAAQRSPAPSPPVAKPAPPVRGGRRYAARSLILIGASTGGTEAIKTVLTALPEDLPGILIVQHIPAQFSLAFANRLNELCRLEVREARNGDVVAPGLALVAPGGYHLIPRWVGSHYVVTTNTGPPVHHQRPAVDVLFDSAARSGVGANALAALLTGMGADGAAGMLALRQAGGTTFAQDEETCVVFGMPREAIRLGAAQRVLPLEYIAPGIDRFANSIALPRA
jgi:two-component system chemotaxis response regulator CheB